MRKRLLISLLAASVLMFSPFPSAEAQMTVSGDNLMQDSAAKLKLKFAMYTQEHAWLQSFWDNVDFDQVDSDLREMKRKGFNGVAVEVNIGEFISSMNPAANTYTPNTVNEAKLQTFVQKAKSLGMYTILWTNIAKLPAGWGGEGVAGELRPEYKDLLGHSYPAYYGYVAPGLQAAAYGNDPTLNTFRWTVVLDFHSRLTELVDDDSVIWDPLDWQYLNLNSWDYGTDENLADWRAYLKKTNTSANYWLGRWGETQTGSWDDVLFPIDEWFLNVLNSPQVQPGDPILKYSGKPLTTNTNKWDDYRAYANAGTNKMIAEITGAIKSVNPDILIGQRIDYWRYGDYRDATWATGQVDFIFEGEYPGSDSGITNVYDNFHNRLNNVRSRLAALGRSKPIVAWETGVNYHAVYGASQSKAYKEAKQGFVVSEYNRIVEEDNLAGLGYWIYRDFPLDEAQLGGLNTMTGRPKPGQTAMTSSYALVNENASFEKDANANNLPDLWESQWRNGTSVNPFAARASNAPHIDGSHEYRLFNGTGDPASYQFVQSDRIPVIAGATYQINAAMRYTLSSGGKAYMSVIHYDKNNNIVTESHRTFDHGGWTWHDNYISFKAHANASYIRIRFGVGGEEGAYLDLDRVRWMSTGLHLTFDDSTLTGEDGETPVNSTGTALDNGVMGKAVVVNGPSSQLTYPAAGNFDPSIGTLETWIQPHWDYDATGASGNKTIFYWAADSNNSFRLAIDGQKTLTAEWKSDGVAKTAVYTIMGWKSNVWHHIAATWNAADGTINLYADGALQQSVSGWAAPTGTSNAIDVGHKAGSEQLDGSLDEVHIYDYVRTANQVQADSRAKPSLWLNFVSDRDGYDAEAPLATTDVPFTEDRFGKSNALSFSNTSVLAYPALGNFHTAAGTVEAWVKSDLPYDPTHSGQSQMIFNWTQQSWVNEFRLWIWSQYNVGVSWYVDGSLYNVNVPISDWTTGSWHHVAATWNKEKQTLKLYVDGTLIGTAAQTAFPSTWADRIDIGSYIGAYDKWNGTIDDVTVYAYDRTDEEILKDFRGY